MEDIIPENVEVKEHLVPWENWKELGLVKAFLLTIKEVMFNPLRFFSQSAFKDTFLWVLLFGVVVLVIITLFYAFIFSTSRGLPLMQKEVSLLGDLFKSPWILLFSPLISAVILLAVSAIFHSAMFIVGAREDFFATVRVICYSTATLTISLIGLLFGSLMFLALRFHWDILMRVVALLGVIVMMPIGVIAQVWPLVAAAIGFKHVHKLSYGRAIVGTIISLFLLFSVLFILMIASVFIRVPFGGKGVCPLAKMPVVSGDYDLTGGVSDPDPNPAYVGDNVSFTYVVRNQGRDIVPEGSFGIEFYVNGKLVSFDRCPPALSNRPEGGVSYGKKKELSIELKPKDFYDFIPQAPGKYTYELIIDTKDKVKETNEDNNKIIGEITVLDNPPLRLWAIGWKDNAPAVNINDNILKEGDSINGFNILKIGKGSVILSKDSQETKLTFSGVATSEQSKKWPVEIIYDFYDILYESGIFPLEQHMSGDWIAKIRSCDIDPYKFLQESFPKKFILVDEKIEGDKATVVLDQEFKFDKPCGYVNEGGRMQPKYVSVRRCTVRMVNEDGAWKIDSFGWRW